MATTLTNEQMLALSKRHVEQEMKGSVEGTMATVCPDPYYELYPMGFRIVGRAAVTEMYRRMLVAPIGLQPIQWATRKFSVGPEGIFSEDEAQIRDTDGTVRRVAAVSVYSFEGELLKGERVYLNDAGAAMTQKALGPDFTKISGVDKI